MRLVIQFRLWINLFSSILVLTTVSNSMAQTTQVFNCGMNTDTQVVNWGDPLCEICECPPGCNGICYDDEAICYTVSTTSEENCKNGGGEVVGIIPFGGCAAAAETAVLGVASVRPCPTGCPIKTVSQNPISGDGADETCWASVTVQCSPTPFNDGIRITNSNTPGSSQESATTK